ncbi:cysteine-rich receptor-like protein kinase 2 [Cynara cardunculus var. scolymus]|uniref:cysteine-rich receptor-like protein kinase 2 n=1 Tax=Cynara cardunculus var. scolymus TaxID=59895 RepID=UPI000D6234EE|nr:cysteine-rich receptor-like protein kinase 2 [Cynara cardunculus var. scolymus]
MAVLIVLLVLLLIEPGTAQSNDLDNRTNIPILSFCGSIAPRSLSNLIKNRDSTLDDLRTQLSRRVLYARAQALSAGDSVFAVAQCRNYLSTDQCVACFDAGVSVLVNCTTGNGAFVFLDDCFIRYEDFADFYNNPKVSQDGTGTPFSSCGNQPASQPTTTFNQTVDKLLSDVRDATPKTSNFYVASTTQITSENATMYAFAQCVENANATSCQTCMDTAYNRLYNCLPSTEGRFFDLGCVARYSETPFFSDNQTTNVINVLKGHSSMVAIIAGAVGGVVLLLLILGLWLLYRLRMKSKKTEEEDLKGGISYNYKDLQLATNDFSEENILGKGGFGEVFKAILDDNSIVAVKKLQVQHARAKEEFQNEVMLISNVHHKNLLRLLGWSSEGSYLLLVLEYMPNGSLDRFLWGAKKGSLDWSQRFEIIFGIARGLAHLHNEFHVKIIHRDIKSSNILLTDDFKPKIADFGLARFQPEDQTHVSTKFAGTLGYTAPEYALRGLLSDKVDTYSYGVVILEIISGRRSTEVKSDSPSAYLLEHAWKLYEEETHVKFIDETLELNEYQREHAMKIIEIGLLCTQSPASKRPTMSEVVVMLQDGQSLGKRQLTRPTFVNNHDRRVNIGSANSNGAPTVWKKPKELEVNEQIHSEKADDKV